MAEWLQVVALLCSKYKALNLTPNMRERERERERERGRERILNSDPDAVTDEMGA
jgi:hypothetical protein